MKKRGIALTEFVLTVAILLLVNIIASQYFFRIDLTEDKRYTIAPATKKILKNLDDVVYVEVYLEGEFPAGFKRLQSSIKETLDEFSIYAGSKVQYKFIDPSAETDPQRRGRIYNQLAQRGIQPTNLFAKEKDKQIEKLIFPGALVVYKEKEVPVQFLKGNKAAGSAEMLNQSVEGVEYELISAIRQLTIGNKKSIAFVEGHGEYPAKDVADAYQSLSKFYNVYRIKLEQINDLSDYDALIIARPQTAYPEQDKFKLDQYIVNGGKVLFFLDAVKVDMDSISANGALAIPYEYSLDDLLFKYGVRVNRNLIQDLNSGFYPMNVGTMGDKPQIQLVNWRYFPLLNTFGDNPIVKNLEAIYSKFISTIDTVKAIGITKTPLIYTSQYCKVYSAPVDVQFNEARKQPDPRDYNQGPLPVCYLLSGEFASLYKNRPLPSPGLAFKEKNKSSQLIVFSDADIIRNDIGKDGREYPLGFDRFSGNTFGNKAFVLNALDYMLNEEGLINVRAKEIMLRPLDKLKVEEERSQWQIINLVLPILLVIVFGIIRYYLRKRRYERF